LAWKEKGPHRAGLFHQGVRSGAARRRTTGATGAAAGTTATHAATHSRRTAATAALLLGRLEDLLLVGVEHLLYF
jgi:hypothetical protein